MSEDAVTLLSVRADASTEVPPDEGMAHCRATAIGTDKPGALGLLARRIDAATTALGLLGGVVRVPRERRPLSWLVRSVSSESETRWDDRRQVQEFTGRVIASADLTIVVRDFALLDAIADALAGVEELHLQHATWSVDDDNPAWPALRAEAIEAALRKGRDYAAALGGAVLRVEHVADIGLLGDGAAEGAPIRRAAFVAQSLGHSDGGPSLDPVPQQLRAGIEARFTASVRPVSQ